MPKPILLDTDIMVDFLRGYPEAVALVKTHVDAIVLSAIVVAELYAGVKGDRELMILDNFVAFCLVLPVTREIARTGGIHKRDYADSHGVGLADALIAATAQTEGIDLKTLNIKHYPMLRGLKPPYTRK
jgi:predicted nucleic acid-binding protein